MKKHLKLSLLLIILFSMSIQTNVFSQNIGESQPGVPDDWKNDIRLNSNYREMEVNDTYQIVVRRLPEIIDDPVTNNVVLPPFHYTVVRGNSVTVNEDGLITANSLGTSIIEVKYDEIEAYGNTYAATSPVNITYLVVDVINPETIAGTSITTDIETRVYDTHYFLGETIYYNFQVEATGADSVAVKCNDYNAKIKGENSYSVRLQNRANIIEIVAYNNSEIARKLYYVIDARRIELNVENITNPGKNFEMGDKAHISFKGITLPVYKLATIYNPQFESPWGGKFATVVFDNEQLGKVKSNVNLTQYDLADNNTIEITFENEGNYIFENGHINEAWWGSPLGTELDMTGPGQPNTNAPTEEDDFSSFPNFGISVGYQPALFSETKLYPESEYYTDASAAASYESTEEQFTSGSFSFKNTSTNWGTLTSWYGTAVSNRTDALSFGGVNNQFNSAAGGDIEGEGNYAVVFDARSSGMGMPEEATITFTNKDYPDGKLIEGLYINNNTWATTSMENGDGFAKKFGGPTGDDPDFFLLTIKGVDKDNNVTGTVEHYLADYRFEDNARDYIQKDWMWVDLTSLGVVTKLQFEMTSSDIGDYGMWTPAYFCVDNVNAPRLRLINPIEDQVITSKLENLEIDLTDVFEDPLNDNLEYSVSYNSNPDLIAASITGNNLTLAYAGDVAGKADISVKATSYKMAAETTFTTTICTAIDTDAIKTVPMITPNPVNDFFTVNVDGDLALYSMNGAKVMDIPNYVQGQNIDASSLPSGVYFVRINNQTIKLIKR